MRTLRSEKYRLTGHDPLSALIRRQAGVCMPFTPSRAECVSQDGKSYIGARFEGCVQPRPVGYDAASLMTLPDGSKSERIVDLPCSPAQEAAFYAFVNRKIDEPYDWKAIFGFASPDLHLHLRDHIICSAFMTAALRAGEIFRWPLTVPFHHVSPRDLLLSSAAWSKFHTKENCHEGYRSQVDHVSRPPGRGRANNRARHGVLTNLIPEVPS